MWPCSCGIYGNVVCLCALKIEVLKFLNFNCYTYPKYEFVNKQLNFFSYNLSEIQ